VCHFLIRIEVLTIALTLLTSIRVFCEMGIQRIRLATEMLTNGHIHGNLSSVPQISNPNSSNQWWNVA